MKKEIEENKKHTDRVSAAHWLAAPFIWLPILRDVFIGYLCGDLPRIAFPLYDLPYIKDPNYIIFDRQKLSYLPWLRQIFLHLLRLWHGFFPIWFGHSRRKRKKNIGAALNIKEPESKP